MGPPKSPKRAFWTQLWPCRAPGCHKQAIWGQRAWYGNCDSNQIGLTSCNWNQTQFVQVVWGPWFMTYCDISRPELVGVIDILHLKAPFFGWTSPLCLSWWNGLIFLEFCDCAVCCVLCAVCTLLVSSPSSSATFPWLAHTNNITLFLFPICSNATKLQSFIWCGDKTAVALWQHCCWFVATHQTKI